MTAYSMLRERLHEVLDTLTERERQVLDHRFGLTDGYSRTLEEVGKQFNVTRERIRQIEAKALAQVAPPDSNQEARRLPGLQIKAILSAESMSRMPWFGQTRPDRHVIHKYPKRDKNNGNKHQRRRRADRAGGNRRTSDDRGNGRRSDPDG